ncbi:MAG: ECF transporter S component, partial [Treponema sp.]|nr:ECF transporter S component [Treponema sp.]
MNEMKKNLSLTRRLALTGAFAALVIVLGITKLGFITIGPTVSITILHVPVILIVMLSGLPEGLFVGATFGLLSLIQASMNPSTLLDPLFVNPLFSVVPRMLVAVVAWGVWKLLNMIPRMPKAISAGLTGFISTLAHTLMVIGFIYLFKGAYIREALGGVGYFGFIAMLGMNVIFEALAATIICVAVYTGLFIASNRKSKLSKE